MPEVKFITHKEKQILYLDVSESESVEDSMSRFDDARDIIIMQPEKSVLLLTNVKNAHYNRNATNHLKEFSSSVTPYIKASAAVGVGGIKRIVLQSLMRISGRDIKMFDDIEEAKDWLVSQGG